MDEGKVSAVECLGLILIAYKLLESVQCLQADWRKRSDRAIGMDMNRVAWTCVGRLSSDQQKIP